MTSEEIKDGDRLYPIPFGQTYHISDSSRLYLFGLFGNRILNASNESLGLNLDSGVPLNLQTVNVWDVKEARPDSINWYWTDDGKIEYMGSNMIPDPLAERYNLTIPDTPLVDGLRTTLQKTKMSTSDNMKFRFVPSAADSNIGYIVPLKGGNDDNNWIVYPPSAKAGIVTIRRRTGNEPGTFGMWKKDRNTLRFQDSKLAVIETNGFLYSKHYAFSNLGILSFRDRMITFEVANDGVSISFIIENSIDTKGGQNNKFLLTYDGQLYAYVDSEQKLYRTLYDQATSSIKLHKSDKDIGEYKWSFTLFPVRTIALKDGTNIPSLWNPLIGQKSDRNRAIDEFTCSFDGMKNRGDGNNLCTVTNDKGGTDQYEVYGQIDSSTCSGSPSPPAPPPGTSTYDTYSSFSKCAQNYYLYTRWNGPRSDCASADKSVMSADGTKLEFTKCQALPNYFEMPRGPVTVYGTTLNSKNSSDAWRTVSLRNNLVSSAGIWAPWSSITESDDSVIRFCAQHDTVTNSPLYVSFAPCANWGARNPQLLEKVKQLYCALFPGGSGCGSLCTDPKSICYSSMSKYCESDNLYSASCSSFCGNSEVNCDAQITAHCATMDYKTALDPSNANMCSCFLSPDFYQNFFEQLKKDVTGTESLPSIPDCYFPQCSAAANGNGMATYRYKQFAKAGATNCPNIQQCIQIANIDNRGEISGNIVVNQSENCNFSPNCTGNQVTVKSSIGGDKYRITCKDCPEGTKPNLDNTDCVAVIPTCDKTTQILVNNKCQNCASGTKPNKDGTSCSPISCNLGQILVNGECKDCPPCKVSNADGTSCSPCPSGCSNGKCVNCGNDQITNSDGNCVSCGKCKIPSSDKKQCIDLQCPKKGDICDILSGNCSSPEPGPGPTPPVPNPPSPDDDNKEKEKRKKILIAIGAFVIFIVCLLILRKLMS